MTSQNSNEGARQPFNNSYDPARQDDFNVIWEGGYLKRRNAAAIGRFDIIERYKLPAKQ